MAKSKHDQGLLLEAHKLTNGVRDEQYGHPKDNFMTIAALWTVYLHRRGFITDDQPLDPRDVAQMNILQKVARDANLPARDHILDIAGYANTIDRLDE